MATATTSEPRQLKRPWVSRFSLAPPARYVLTAALLMVGLYTAYYYPYDPDHPIAYVIQAYLRLLAHAAGGLIALFDAGASVHDTLISGRFPLVIVKSCSALDAQALYMAAVLAFPTRLQLKALGLVLGVVVLSGLNVLRLAGLYFVGVHAPASFDTLHEEVLPLILVGLACGCFVGWTRWARRDQPKTD